MELSLTEEDKFFVILHLIFMGLCAIILALPSVLAIGIKLFILVISYNLLVVVFGLILENMKWLYLWFFTFIISIFQIFPDWFLSAELRILVFPDDGLFKIGTVSGYMIGLWTIPLFIICFIGLRIKDKGSKKKALYMVSLLSLIIFGLAEQSMWLLNSWYPQNVTLIFDHTALYIIIPEVILGLSTYQLFIKVYTKNLGIYILNAFIVMIVYLGSAGFFYFLFEKIILLN